MQQTGKVLIIIGGLIVIAGLLLFVAGNRLNWLGRLPGDIRIERPNFRFYMPLATMLLLSLLLSLLIWVFNRFFH